MGTPALLGLLAMLAVGVTSTIIGMYGIRMRRSTSDFLVASRRVGPVANASAISGEYLSAAAFLGIAATILRDGADGLWAAVAYVGGYLALLLFVAAPLRRSGAYTVPDFAEARLPSPGLRRVCTAIVLLIGTLYLLPQLQGAGLVLQTVTGLPPWSGAVGAAVIVLLTVIGGGMRSITFVQAFQFWLKFAALAIPAMVILSLFMSDNRTLDRPAPPRFPADAVVDITVDVRLKTVEPVTFRATGLIDGEQVVDNAPVTWAPGEHVVARGGRLEFAAGSPVPAVFNRPATDQAWIEPMGRGGGLDQMLTIYSTLIAGFLGTMGLPHVLVRFYTNPDGRAARRTTIVVLAMIGAFYVAVVLLGAFSRLYTPQLMMSGSDAAVLLLPTAALGDNVLGWLLAAMVAAGAAAAFLATSSGLVVSLAGVLFTDVMRGRWHRFRLAAVLSMVVPLALAVSVTRLDFALTIPLVFAVAASTFCPLLVLGIWWRGLTAPGAITGVVVGALLSGASVVAALFTVLPDNPLGTLLYRPALISVPAAFLTMVLVSKLTKGSVPPDVDRTLLTMHAPERLGLGGDRLARRSQG
ncbi:sodium/solute symporter [Pseudonocardia humida]|uniref:Cation acetate symporter n=1 Tax=Pseudonocardia humida TaxID=2800819 RepID=A0ABT1A5A9_9PSEU|nr:cation acetate symporter [Pseudonocardia humida]MCO1657949.1 cation acetate symporter [Pseudonocardia humida]